jgi:hypothetical protein
MTSLDDAIARLRTICLDLPEAYEEQAWVGTRWVIRRHTFAHVLAVDDGWPPAYARAAGSAGPLTVLTFVSAGAELEVLRGAGPPFFRPPWRRNLVGLVIGSAVDWDEVAELMTESYCVLAPRKLVRSVGRPAG